MTFNYLRIAAAAGLALVLAGCGGGGGGGGGSGAAAGSSVVSSGVITGFGSIHVNGVHFETTGAEFLVDDAPGGQDDLAVGDVVQIRGRVNDDGRTGTATTVSSQDAVDGRITALDVLAGTLTVAGQSVQTDADTSFDASIPGSSLAGLIVGDAVEVAGFLDSTGVIRATRIEKKPAGQAVEVHGVVADLDTVNRRFRINALNIDYSAATLRDFPGGQLSNGDFVEAKGSTFVGDVLQATKVELETPESDDGDKDVKREIEGLITRFVSATDFDVAGRPVTTTSSTVYENGTVADLAANLKVEVEGPLNAGGILVARKVSIRRAGNVRVASLVDSVDAASGTLIVLGITIKVDPLTRLEDKSDADVASFSLADLRVGDYVEVRGAEFPAASGQLLARRLEREDAESRSFVQGPVTAVMSPDLGVFGVTVQTVTGTEFEDRSGNRISSNSFFSLVLTGDQIKAQGSVLSGQVIQAEQVEFEFEDD